MARTWWRDIKDVLDDLIHKDRRTLLDVGCGYGHFAEYMAGNGWEVVGVEPSNEAREACSARAIPVFESVEDLRRNHTHGFSAVTLLNVLEHVPDPADLLGDLRPLMTVGESVLVCKVPNDFSPLQLAAQAKLERAPWWVVLPDHLNYFNFASLTRLLHRLGFEVLDMIGTFPMEVFLLYGDNYLESQEVGELCHKKRRAFELSIPPELRRSLYRCFARAGIGRECIVFARATRR
jgi:2-polyprenyl-3-methyl-5-hydroxy-6-metoxy-1,4-benzoquinol methylase